MEYYSLFTMWQQMQNPLAGQKRLGMPSARPTMIIRSSKEERTQDEVPMQSSSGFEFDALAAPHQLPPRPEVYVSRRCPYSGQLVDYAQLLKLPITIIDIDSQGVPPWLPGTPTVRDKGAGYCGDSAFTYLKHEAESRSGSTSQQQQQQEQQQQPQVQSQHEAQGAAASPFMSAPAAADSSMGAGLSAVYSNQAQQGMLADLASDAKLETSDPKDTERSMARLMNMRKPLGDNAIRK
jgi:hypothetical protein